MGNTEELLSTLLDRQVQNAPILGKKEATSSFTDTIQVIERPAKPRDFLAVEYTALRDEILKRTEIQYQIISYALIAFGTLVPIGLQYAPTVILFYPILAFFLAATWSQNDIRIRQMRAYIANYAEKLLLNNSPGWENSRVSSVSRGFVAILFPPAVLL